MRYVGIAQMSPTPRSIDHNIKINPPIIRERNKSGTNHFVIFRLALMAAIGPISFSRIQKGTIDNLNDQRIPGIISKRNPKFIKKKLIILAIRK